MAWAVLMVPVAVETGDAAVMEDVEGFLDSSFKRCSLVLEKPNRLIALLIVYAPN